MENSYQYQREIQELRDRLKVLKKRRNMAQLKGQLNELNCMYKDINGHIEALDKNVSYANKEMQQIFQVLDHDNKIHMEGECAENIKGILQAVGNLVQSIGHQKINCDALNSVNKHFLNNISRKVDKYKADCNSKKRLIANVGKLTGTVSANNNENPTIIISGDSDNVKKHVEIFGSFNTMSSVLTFCEDHLIASSPLPDK